MTPYILAYLLAGLAWQIFRTVASIAIVRVAGLSRGSKPFESIGVAWTIANICTWPLDVVYFGWIVVRVVLQVISQRRTEARMKVDDETRAMIDEIRSSGI